MQIAEALMLLIIIEYRHAMATDWSMQQFFDEIFIEAQFFSN
jgi:hypothetical protein